MHRKIYLFIFCFFLCLGLFYFFLSDKENEIFKKVFVEENSLKDNKKIKQKNNFKVNFKRRQIAQSGKESLSSKGDEKSLLDKSEILSLLKELINPSSNKQKWAREKLLLEGERILNNFFQIASDLKVDPLIRLQVVELMGDIANRETALMLRELLPGSDIVFKREVMRSMGKIASKENIQDLVQYINHEDPTLTAESLESIYNIAENNELDETAELEKKLISLLDDNTSNRHGYEVLVMTNAVKVLSKLDSEKSVDAIIRNFEITKDREFKHDIALSLVLFSSAKAKGIVEEYLNDLKLEQEKALDALIKGHLQLLIDEVQQALKSS